MAKEFCGFSTAGFAGRLEEERRKELEAELEAAAQGVEAAAAPGVEAAAAQGVEAAAAPGVEAAAAPAPGVEQPRRLRAPLSFQERFFVQALKDIKTNTEYTAWLTPTLEQAILDKLSIIEKRLMNFKNEVHEAVRQIQTAVDVYKHECTDPAWFIL